MAKPLLDFSHLSLAERLLLVEDLWDSIAAETDAMPALTEAERAELRRRLASHDLDPSSAIPWDRVRAELEHRDT
ncbi:MAG: addiction module protein [Planctomycetes bacterium]|nr:addiction module protein [Planctomycetota bacterium]